MQTQLTFELLPHAVGQLLIKLDNIERLLHQFSDTQNQTASDALLTVEEAASFLNLAVPTIYGMVQRRVIPFSKPGKHLYFCKTELTEWVKESRRKTTSEIQAEARKGVRRG